MTAILERLVPVTILEAPLAIIEEATIVPYVAPPASERARFFAEASHAAGTLTAYASDWRSFTAWCADERLSPIPAAPETICEYLTWCADEAKLKAASISRRLASIAHYHAEDGFSPSPTLHVAVKRVWRGIRRTIGTAQRGKEALVVDLLRRVVPEVASERVQDVRDRALLLLGFAMAGRRGEIVALNREDLAFNANGLDVTISFSKTDKFGEGETLPIAYGSHLETCPVRACRRWLDLLPADPTGAVFRQVNRGGAKGERLRSKSVAEIVKKACRNAGLDASTFAAHSLRSGLITTASMRNINDVRISLHSRHATLGMVRRYTKKVRIWDDCISAQVGL